ncbi:LysR family transcriptional regulator [Amycolatopsis sp. WAC 04169]|uniref:TniQ family protein n=1 Tax=Amycolatopsis sp. WAC 04169 TaxID=2203197 RepID=UPI000F78AF93|nr:TniQ family protein [Amycolatopsis sp. WAC 04169]RSN36818.1 LysR family transcriptional regulator [Amycolatopsis sp. WAC 04169]
MNRPRTLPIRVAPLPGEALDSWFTAIAHRLHTPLGGLLPQLGLGHRSPEMQVSAQDLQKDWTTLLFPAELAAVSAATGESENKIEAMTLHRFGGAVVIDTAQRKVNHWLLWGRQRGSRFCPECLAHAGGRWQLSWRLGWSFACILHRRLLVDVCPDCRRVLRRHPLWAQPQPGHCVEPAEPDATGRDPARCGADLSTARSVQFRADHPVIQAQQVILDLIEQSEGTFGVYASNPISASTALADLRAIGGRVLSYARYTDLKRFPEDLMAAYYRENPYPPGTASRRGFMAPAGAATAAVGATASVMILACDTVPAAGESLRWLVERLRDDRLTATPTSMASWGRGTSTTLRAVQISAIDPLLKPSDQLRYWVAAKNPVRGFADPRSRSRRSRVPAMFWTAYALRLRPDLRLSLRALRPALSAALLLPGTRYSLHDASELLRDVPDAHDASRILQRLRSHPCWRDILSALTRLADHLDSEGSPIDYHRRRRLNYSDLLPDSRWHDICRNTGFPPGRSRVQLARCLLFEKISTLPVNRAPASFAVSTSYARDRLLNFGSHITLEVAQHLAEAAQDFLARHRIKGEPVDWQPPADLFDGLALPGHDPDLIDIPALHDLVRRRHGSLSDTADRLGTTLDMVRHLLDNHPAPTGRLTEARGRATGQQRYAARTALPKELLTQLYVEEHRTLRAIGERVGVSRQTITRLLDEYDIERAPQRRPSKAIGHEWLHEQYVNQRRTLPELARETGMSTASMNRWAKTHNIPLRPRGGASHRRSSSQSEPGPCQREAEASQDDSI